MAIPKAIRSETPRETFERWLSDGTTWIGIFENHDLGHSDLGRRIARPYDASQEEVAKLKSTTASDHKAIGFGWRYILVAKCHTADEAIAALEAKP